MKLIYKLSLKLRLGHNPPLVTCFQDKLRVLSQHRPKFNTMQSLMNFLLAWLTISFTVISLGDEVPRHVAKQRTFQILASSAETPDRPYLAFPAILERDTDVLISYKHGRSHAGDADSTLEWIRLEKDSDRKISQQTLAAVNGEIMQMGEWVRFPNGDIANYIDAQRSSVLRTGLAFVRSADRGHTFGSVQRLGRVDGVEYGYAFDAISQNGSTWMLVMTFANLPGGKLVYKYASQPGSVDVIQTDDNGHTWRFVSSITKELGDAPINESAFVPYKDGFIVASRGYDSRQWLMRTDRDFKRLAATNLPTSYPFFKTADRPRLFQRDGFYYLLGRNRVGERATELALFKLNPENLSITRHVVLDTSANQSAGDSFYAQPYWQVRNAQTLFQIITYKRMAGPGLDIVRFEFDWDDVR